MDWGRCGMENKKYWVTRGCLNREGNRVIVSSCPICQREHRHGIRPEEKKLGYLIRYSHCDREPGQMEVYKREYYVVGLL